MSVRPPAFQNTISTGQILQPAALVAAVTALWFIFGSDRDAKDALKKVDKVEIRVDKLETNITSQIDGLRSAIDRRFDLQSKQIDTLPLVAERLLQVGAEAKNAAARADAVAAKLVETDRTAYDAREAAKRLETRVDRLDQQVNAPVPVRQTR